MRNIGNKNKIPSKHPDGNKGGFAGGGPMGRASGSQQSSARGFNPFQKGAPPATGQKPSPPSLPSANKPTPQRSFAKDMQENTARNRTPQSFGIPAMKRRMGT